MTPVVRGELGFNKVDYRLWFLLLFLFLRKDTPKDKTTNKATLLSLRLPWSKVHLGSSDLWSLWSCLFDGGVGGVGSKPSFYRSIVL